MLKIITGLFKGLHLVMPKDPLIRPTAAPVREAIFSILGQKTMGASVLDLFAGSGAMGLEALSRGADKLLLCDQSPLALAAMESNLKKIPSALTDKVKIIKATFPKSYGRLIKEGPFSLILLDPPYADPIENVINFLAWATKNKLASSDATVVWEQAPQSLKLWDPQSLVGWETVLTRRWGKRAVAILELNNEPNDSKTQNNEMIRVDQA